MKKAEIEELDVYDDLLYYGVPSEDIENFINVCHTHYEAEHQREIREIFDYLDGCLKVNSYVYIPNILYKTFKAKYLKEAE